MSERRAIVIGGGIGGLTTAIALRGAGFDVDVFERAAELNEVGAGISLWSNALGVLDRLNLGEAIRAVSVPARSIGLRTWQGEVLVSDPLVGLEATRGVVCRVMHRAELQAALYRACGPARVHLAARAVGFREDPDGVVVELDGGETVRGDLLVGADGLHSIVRAGLWGHERPRYSGYTAWRAAVRFDMPGGASETWGYGARFGQAAMSGGRLYWFATKNSAEGQRADDEKADLLHTFRGWHAPVEAIIAATDPSAILRNDIVDRPPLRRWGRGRVTLVGDAAHPMTPNLGQGACQAIEDALALALSLDRHRGIPEALGSYEAMRIPRTSAIVARSRDVGRLGQIENRTLATLRNALMRRTPARFQTRQLAQVIDYEVR
jgi:2-polyprenyl-6-methoxyphenol hydroxylase-like FAD-dependent oxidoreductase